VTLLAGSGRAFASQQLTLCGGAGQGGCLLMHRSKRFPPPLGRHGGAAAPDGPLTCVCGGGAVGRRRCRRAGRQPARWPAAWRGSHTGAHPDTRRAGTRVGFPCRRLRAIISSSRSRSRRGSSGGAAGQVDSAGARSGGCLMLRQRRRRGCGRGGTGTTRRHRGGRGRGRRLCVARRDGRLQIFPAGSDQAAPHHAGPFRALPHPPAARRAAARAAGQRQDRARARGGGGRGRAAAGGQRAGRHV
jgi:hypothetical protein